MRNADCNSWIFVSHCSDDILRVREVRNYLESQGASPLLFHLLALNEPDQFWPLIQQEIAIRNFFLYCESASSRIREWVIRERAEVEALAKIKPIRIGSVCVDDAKLNTAALDAFLVGTRVFPSFSRLDLARVSPFLDELKNTGFQVFEVLNLEPGTFTQRTVRSELDGAARNGIFVAFLSQASIKNVWVFGQIGYAIRRRAKLILVTLDAVEVPERFSTVRLLDAVSDPDTAPSRLLKEVLTMNL